MELFYPLMLDGANGTELQKRGYDGSVCAERWVLEHPEAIQDFQREYAMHGSKVIYAPTFGANRVKLEENGIFNQVAQFNKDLVRISREALPDDVLVAGDIATTGKFLAPLGDLTFDELYDIYYEQAKALEDAGVDMFVIETIMTVPDARAALLAVKAVSDKPVLVSFTCDENGRTLTGTDVLAACVIIQGMGADAFGLNCSVGPEELLKQIKRLRTVAEIPLAAKPNAGLPKTVDGKTVYDCTPEEFVRFTKDFAEAGVGLFGGCCGTGPEHLAALGSALKGVGFRPPEPERLEGILCATEKDAFVIEPGTKIDEMISCEAGLEERLRAANRSDAAVIALSIDKEADLDEFGTSQYVIKKPLCIVCDDLSLLEEALRLYQGRAIYSGNIDRIDLEPLVKKYGLIT